MSVQEQKQAERQQHMEDQQLHAVAWLDQSNYSLASNATNGTDHVDDFIARIDKLRQVWQGPALDSFLSAVTVLLA